MAGRYSTDKDFGTVTKKSVRAGGTVVAAVLATNTNAALRWLLVHNKATIPTGGDVPHMAFPIPGGSAANPGICAIGDDWFTDDEVLGTGLGWSISTTPGSFTDSATASDHTVHMRYR